MKNRFRSLSIVVTQAMVKSLKAVETTPIVLGAKAK